MSSRKTRTVAGVSLALPGCRTEDVTINSECCVRLSTSGKYGRTLELRVGSSGHGEFTRLSVRDAAALQAELAAFIRARVR